MKNTSVFATFGTSGAAFGWPVAKQISLESYVFFINFANRALRFCYFWSSGGIARLGMNGSRNESIVRKKKEKQNCIEISYALVRFTKIA